MMLGKESPTKKEDQEGASEQTKQCVPTSSQNTNLHPNAFIGDKLRKKKWTERRENPYSGGGTISNSNPPYTKRFVFRHARNTRMA